MYVKLFHGCEGIEVQGDVIMEVDSKEAALKEARERALDDYAYFFLMALVMQIALRLSFLKRGLTSLSCVRSMVFLLMILKSVLAKRQKPI